MNVKQCDRCKAFYRKDEIPKFALTKINASNANARYRHSVDLCYECIDELEIWFKEKGNDDGNSK